MGCSGVGWGNPRGCWWCCWHGTLLTGTKLAFTYVMCVCGVGYHPSIVIVAPIVATVVVVMDDVVRIVVVAGSKNTT